MNSRLLIVGNLGVCSSHSENYCVAKPKKDKNKEQKIYCYALFFFFPTKLAKKYHFVYFEISSTISKVI